MERPEIIGWEVTTNKNGVKMATLPLDKMHEIVKYIEHTDKIRLGVAGDQTELLLAFGKFIDADCDLLGSGYIQEMVKKFEESKSQ